MDKSANQPMWIGLAILAVIALFYFGILPKNRAIKDLNLQVAEKRAEADALDSRVAALTQLSSVFKADQKDYDKLLVALPAEAKPDEIFMMLQAIASGAGVNITNIQTKDSLSSNHTTGISVTVTGDFPAMVKFGDALKKNIRPITIDNINFTTKDKNGLSGTYDLGFFVSQSSKSSTAAGVGPGAISPATSQ